MNYELAKQLKDAGFPDVIERHDRKQQWIQDDPESHEYIFYPELAPTLEELIEACGDRFEELNRVGHGKKPKWSAVSYSCEECGIDVMKMGRGSSPLEAVARLWLEIN